MSRMSASGVAFAISSCQGSRPRARACAAIAACRCRRRLRWSLVILLCRLWALRLGSGPGSRFYGLLLVRLPPSDSRDIVSRPAWGMYSRAQPQAAGSLQWSICPASTLRRGISRGPWALPLAHGFASTCYHRRRFQVCSCSFDFFSPHAERARMRTLRRSCLIVLMRADAVAVRGSTSSGPRPWPCLSWSPIPVAIPLAIVACTLSAPSSRQRPLVFAAPISNATATSRRIPSAIISPKRQAAQNSAQLRLPAAPVRPSPPRPWNEA